MAWFSAYVQFCAYIDVHAYTIDRPVKAVKGIVSLHVYRSLLALFAIW